jgi:anti-sigma B factor antagonist
MEITHRTTDTCTIVEINGDLDGKTAPIANEYIEKLYQPKCSLLLDMSKVLFMSSAGLRLMLSVHRTINEVKGTLVLVGLSEDIEDTMRETGFLTHFTVCETVEEGLETL